MLNHQNIVAKTYVSVRKTTIKIKGKSLFKFLCLLSPSIMHKFLYHTSLQANQDKISNILMSIISKPINWYGLCYCHQLEM